MSKAHVKFTSNLSNVNQMLSATALLRMNQVVHHLVDKTKETLTGQRHGRRYIIPGLKTIMARQAKSGRKLSLAQRNKRKYTASAPGEAPAVLFGHLRNSIKYKVVGRGLKLTGIVGSKLEKAPWLEFGTSKMAARPFLRPTYEKERGFIKKILKRGWLP